MSGSCDQERKKMASNNAPWLKTVAEHFCPAYKCELYLKKNKDIEWCIANTSQIERKAKDLKTLFFKQIKLKVGYYVIQQLKRKCKIWLLYLSNYGLGQRSTNKFRKFVRYIKKINHYCRYGIDDSDEDYHDSDNEDDKEGYDPDHEDDGHTESDAYSDNGYGDENEDDDCEDDDPSTKTVMKVMIQMMVKY